MNTFPSKSLAPCLVCCFWLSSEGLAQQWLKEDTAVTVKLGPFVDNVDGYTPKDSLMITQGEVRLSKNGGDFAQKSDSSSASHNENGYYSVTLNATDTSDPGRLRVAVNESGALPVWQDFMVLPASTYDALVGGSAPLPANVTQVLGEEDIAGNLATYFGGGGSAGYGQLLLHATIVDQTSGTSFKLSTGPVNAGALNGQTIVMRYYDNGSATRVDTVTSSAYSGGDFYITVAEGVGLQNIVGAQIDVLAESKLTTAIKSKTDLLPSASAGTNGGLPTVDANNAVKVQSGNGAGQILLSSGAVTIGTNNDKVGYSLSNSQTFSTTGSVGSVTGNVGGISGISFPLNFSSLTITSGHVDANVTHWINDPVSTSVPGVPRVDVTHLLGSEVCD